MRISSSYQSTFFLLFSIIMGGFVGVFSGEWIVYIKPIAQVFLNFLICVMLPFVFFSVSHAVSKLDRNGGFGILFGFSLLIFLFMGVT